ncbi:MAG TPA: hypothetical protein VFH61_04660 [Thermoleophilia bacterium]|nr:hypothetical protein [Thermoleophilia bacterium]
MSPMPGIIMPIFGFDLYSIAEALYGEGFRVEEHTSRHWATVPRFAFKDHVSEETWRREYLWVHLPDCSICVGDTGCET